MAELRSDTDTSSPKFLRDKYAIIGVGETAYTRRSGRTTKHMAVEAVRNAMNDAGLGPADIDGMMSYSAMDSTMSPAVGADLGIRLDFYMDVVGGGASIEALVGLAMGAIEAGMCKTVVLFRSMNGATGTRMGGTGRAAPRFSGGQMFSGLYGLSSPAQMFSHTVIRGKSARFWKMRAVGRLLGPMPAMSWPPIRTVPLDGSRNPDTARRRVVFPQPDGPTTAQKPPSSTETSSPSSTGNGPAAVT